MMTNFERLKDGGPEPVAATIGRSIMLAMHIADRPITPFELINVIPNNVRTMFYAAYLSDHYSENHYRTALNDGVNKLLFNEGVRLAQSSGAAGCPDCLEQTADGRMAVQSILDNPPEDVNLASMYEEIKSNLSELTEKS